MKRTIFALTLFATFNTAFANPTIYVGGEGGAYEQAGIRLGAQLPNIPSIVNTSGSMAILDKVNNDIDGAGFTQADSALLFNKLNPKNNIKKLTSIGEECAMLIVNKNGKIKSEDDLGKEGVKVGVGNVGSGADATLLFMSKLDESYGKIEKLYDDPETQLINLANNDEIDGFMFVAKPSLENKYVKIVNGNENIKFVPLNDYNMNDNLDGEPIYTFGKFPVKKGFFGTEQVEAPCTKIMAVTNKNGSHTKDISKVLLMNPNSLMNAGK